jgi:hypothetical protein
MYIILRSHIFLKYECFLNVSNKGAKPWNIDIDKIF